ncbi:MAG: M24 family metallopeptidase [Eubacteriales bacterium]|nr:M24 family metallopeptidase [Eubacteriales bacterium]
MEQRIDLMTGLYYHITRQEIARRHELIRKYMREKKLGVILVLVPHREGYRRWLSGVDGTERRTESCFVIPRKGTIFHVLGSSMAREAKITEKPEGAMPDPEEAFDGIQTIYCFSAFEIRHMLEESGEKRLGVIHGEEMRAQMHDYLEEFLPDIELVDVTGEFSALKAVKSPEEQALIQRAVFLQERVMEGLWGYLKPGMTEAEAVRYARYLANRLGSGGIDSMETAQVRLISWKERQSGEPLYYPGRYLSEGDMIQITLKIMGDSGFYGTLARCVSLGEPSVQNQEAWRRVRLLQERIEEKLKPGVSLKAIRKEIETLARKLQIPFMERHFLHGIGYCVLEAPDESTSSDELVLKEGMVLASEPRAADEAGNIFGCGDVYRITALGAVRMTTMPGELKVL